MSAGSNDVLCQRIEPNVCRKSCEVPGKNACVGKTKEYRPSTCTCSAAWGRWSGWICTDLCNATYQQRNRTCTKPEKNACFGPNYEQRPSQCVPCSADRTVCPPYRWGPQCSSNCFNCVDQCDGEGRCSKCIVGYKYPNYSCSQECELFEFGANCEGDCKQKCGEDCRERIDGTCPFKKVSLLWLLVLLLPIGLLAHILERKKSVPDEDDDPKTTPTESTARDTGDKTEATTTGYSNGSTMFKESRTGTS
ncbi:hypothetical protein Btru_017473 [Bulinus truncatus]|nr:hypothetical protein Btru_017473 [Bulinus truncatus]